MQKIFQVGLDYCDEISIYHYLANNGIAAIYYDDGRLAQTIQSNYEQNLPLIAGYESYQAYFQIKHTKANGQSLYPAHQHLAALLSQFPNALFIFNYLSVDSWLENRINTYGLLPNEMRLHQLSETEIIELWKQNYQHITNFAKAQFATKLNSKQYCFINLDKDSPSKLTEFLSLNNIKTDSSLFERKPNTRGTTNTKAHLNALKVSFERLKIKDDSLIEQIAKAYSDELKQTASEPLQPSKSVLPSKPIAQMRETALFLRYHKNDLNHATSILSLAESIQPCSDFYKHELLKWKTEIMSNKIEKLKEFGAQEFVHMNGSMLSHLQGVAQILTNWGEREAIVDAGLFHAIYGPDGLGGKLLDHNKRAAVKRIIGQEAEELVYLFCACDKEFVLPQFANNADEQTIIFKDRFNNSQFPFPVEHIEAFCRVTVANDIDIVSNSDHKTYPEYVLRTAKNMFNQLNKTAQQQVLEIFEQTEFNQ